MTTVELKVATYGFTVTVDPKGSLCQLKDLRMDYPCRPRDPAKANSRFYESGTTKREFVTQLGSTVIQSISSILPPSATTEEGSLRVHLTFTRTDAPNQNFNRILELPLWSLPSPSFVINEDPPPPSFHIRMKRDDVEITR